jgi:hypothetical protein
MGEILWETGRCWIVVVFLAICVWNMGLLISPKGTFVSLIRLNQRLRRWMNLADGEMEAALENVKQWPPTLAVRLRWFGLIGLIVNTAVFIHWITTAW